MSSMPCVWSACAWVSSIASSRSTSAIEQLLAQIRPRVDQHLRLAAFGIGRSTNIEQRRRRFFGLFGSHSPQPCPTRGTPPDDPQPRMVTVKRHAAAASGGIFENSRRAFSVVIAPSSAGVTPLTSARTRAVSAT